MPVLDRRASDGRTAPPQICSPWHTRIPPRQPPTGRLTEFVVKFQRLEVVRERREAGLTSIRELWPLTNPVGYSGYQEPTKGREDGSAAFIDVVDHRVFNRVRP